MGNSTRFREEIRRSGDQISNCFNRDKGFENSMRVARELGDDFINYLVVHTSLFERFSLFLLNHA